MDCSPAMWIGRRCRARAGGGGSAPGRPCPFLPPQGNPKAAGRGALPWLVSGGVGQGINVQAAAAAAIVRVRRTAGAA